MKKLLTIGDAVLWRDNYGKAPHRTQKVESITEIVDADKDYTNPLKEIDWDEVDSRRIIVTLDNGKWAYGTQIEQKF